MYFLKYRDPAVLRSSDPGHEKFWKREKSSKKPKKNPRKMYIAHLLIVTEEYLGLSAVTMIFEPSSKYNIYIVVLISTVV